jgi:hypothetical protein
VVDGRQRALQTGGRPQLRQRHVGLFLQQFPQTVLTRGHDPGLAPGMTVPGFQIPGPPPLLEELLDHPERHPETLRHGLPRKTFPVVHRKNPFPQIQ